MADPVPVNLLVIPYAGGSAAHMTPLLRSLPSWVRARAVELPGRGRRWRDTPVDTLEAAVRDLIAAIPFDGSFAVFGHSLGAYLALALMARMEDHGDHRGTVLFAAANVAPGRRRRFLERPAATLSEDQILELAARFGPVPDAVITDPDLREGLIRILRSDFALSDSFLRQWNGRRISAPIVALAGTDEPFTAEDVTQWGRSTETDFREDRIRGGHFFPVETPTETATTIVRHLARLARDGLWCPAPPSGNPMSPVRDSARGDPFS